MNSIKAIGNATAVAANNGAKSIKKACQIAGGKLRPSSGIMTGGPAGWGIGIHPDGLLNYSNTVKGL